MSASRQIYKRCAQRLPLWRVTQSISSWPLNTIRISRSTDFKDYATSTPTQQTHHPNPGNFANRPKEELREISKRGGQKGGRATGVGGFHDMDPQKQREIAAKGGRASHGSTAEGKVAGEGGRKRGRPRKGSGFSEEYEDIVV
ncbi:conidiation-specific protein Con-10, putative [Talaromyces stipitatus ATCC 10500]|uniref:Conidiation-specific protein Con-10, putative n=1 Tax=Talaromyces stipitatus (strain ATCC 10500 / CBS 375.48 / QM 6759 / NRRL 1006) TaxID=441959 RepID=B8M9L9_TALSN|nr:conidiation-specific protein Con-10, putative [Talaromyces stipitatus ATCC 10500]EED18021.1 conidiation-specific protein Con-10, putative [Talaromyces stipitatus ATCC 10500]